MNLPEFKAWLDGYTLAGGKDLEVIKAKLAETTEPFTYPWYQPITWTPWVAPTVTPWTWTTSETVPCSSGTVYLSNHDA